MSSRDIGSPRHLVSCLHKVEGGDARVALMFARATEHVFDEGTPNVCRGGPEGGYWTTQSTLDSPADEVVLNDPLAGSELHSNRKRLHREACLKHTLCLSWHVHVSVAASRYVSAGLWPHNAVCAKKRGDTAAGICLQSGIASVRLCQV